MMGVVLVVTGYVLLRNHRLNWTTTGFWSFLAFILYYLLNPLASLLTGNTTRYRLPLVLADGYQRGVWILIVLVIGISIFLITYIKTTARPVNWLLDRKDQRITVPMLLVFFFIYILAFYSLLVYRSFFLPTSRQVIIQEGRFIGDTTGYEYASYMFLFVPILFLLLSNYPTRRGIGWLTFFLFMILSLPNGWSRFASLSMILAITIFDALRNKTRRPHWAWIAAGIIVAAILQARGHEIWTINQLPDHVIDAVSRIFSGKSNLFVSADTSMLPTWYLESYVKDHITGYNFGLPLINYVISGWIPGRIFPDKYFLIEWLNQTQPQVYSPSSINYLFGAKSSLMGSFYGSGGLIGVILLMALMGYGCRKLDGMLAPENPILIKALGISWMSILWMVWGSHDYWGVTVFGVIVIPAILIWIVSPKIVRTRDKPLVMPNMDEKIFPEKFLP
jgi:hypothetical protein